MSEKWTSAKHLLEAFENVNLHTMTARESERLHTECKWIMSTIEEFWAKWDNPPGP